MPTDATPPTRVRAADELKHVALEQFASVGFAGTSLQQIADHAGYSKSSVLYHYASKEALLEAAIGPAIDAMESLLGDFVASGRTPPSVPSPTRSAKRMPRSASRCASASRSRVPRTRSSRAPPSSTTTS